MILTRDEADRLDADGRVELIREGELGAEVISGPLAGRKAYEPPAEFVEAAKPCETCEGNGSYLVAVPPSDVWSGWSRRRQACPSCLGGKRRIAAVVPCERCERIRAVILQHGLTRNDEPCDDCGQIDGLVPVATVVVEWGPLVVHLDTDDRAFRPVHPCVIVGTGGNDAGSVSVWHGDGDFTPITLPPDVDPATLVGEYALGIRNVDRTGDK